MRGKRTGGRGEGREIEAEKLRFEAKEAAKDKASVELYYDQLSAEKDRLADAGIETERAFVLTGWIRGIAVTCGTGHQRGNGCLPADLPES